MKDPMQSLLLKTHSQLALRRTERCQLLVNALLPGGSWRYLAGMEPFGTDEPGCRCCEVTARGQKAFDAIADALQLKHKVWTMGRRGIDAGRGLKIGRKCDHMKSKDGLHKKYALIAAVA